jgi:hypothetical protein
MPHRAVLDLPNIAEANAVDNYQYNQFQVVSNFLHLLKHKWVRYVCMKRNPAILDSIRIDSLTVCFDISGRHIASTSDFSCNHDLITRNFTIFHPAPNESFRVTFGCSLAIRRNRILLGSIDQIHPVFQNCLVLRNKNKESNA